MTQRNLIELLELDFGARPENYWKLLIHGALREFGEQTHLFVRATHYVTDGLSPRLALGHAPFRLTEVYVKGEPVRMSDSRAYTRIPEGKTFWYVDGGTAEWELVLGVSHAHGILPLPEGTPVTVFSVVPTAIPATLDEELPVPPEYQQAIEARVRERFMTTPEDRAYWHAIWKDLTRRARVQGRAGIGPATYTILVPDL